KYDPALYQRQAQLSAPDEYGFGQVEKFDKYVFDTKPTNTKEKYVVVGYPEDFDTTKLDLTKLQKIKVGTEEIFWICDYRCFDKSE
ncbi:MAG: hypothetical protein ACD_13C00068G0001, partial [uncultured bacterium]